MMSDFSEIGNSSSEYDFGADSIKEDTESELKENATPSEESDTFELISTPSEASLPSVKAPDTHFAPSDTPGTHFTVSQQSTSIGDRIKKLLPHRQSVEASNTSPLFVKLQDANHRWWNSLHSQPEVLRKDVQSTTKRIGLRLDKTQSIAVDNSNQIRSSIRNLRTCRSVVDNVIVSSKTILPTFKVNEIKTS